MAVQLSKLIMNLNNAPGDYRFLVSTGTRYAGYRSFHGGRAGKGLHVLGSAGISLEDANTHTTWSSRSPNCVSDEDAETIEQARTLEFDYGPTHPP